MNKDSKVEKEIKAVLDQMAVSFAEKDSKKYLDIFTNQKDVVIYGSQKGEKWTSVKTYMKSVNKNWQFVEEIKVVYDWISIKNQGDVAWIATDVIFKSKMGNQTMNVPGRLTAVLLKENSSWKIVQSHFSMENRSP